MIAILLADHGLSVRHACEVASLSRAAYYRPPPDRLDRDAEVIAALTALVTETPQRGFWMCFDALRLAGHRWNAKRVYRVYCALKLNLKRRAKRRIPPRERQPLDAPAVLNGMWAVDFMSDMLYSGTRSRTLNVLDEGNREALAVEVALSLPAARVTQVRDQLVALHGAPSALRCDNGPEFVSVELTTSCRRHGVRLLHIQPGKPNQNAYYRTLQRELSQGSARRVPFRLARRRPRRNRALAHDLQHAAAARQPRPGPAAHLPAEVTRAARV